MKYHWEYFVSLIMFPTVQEELQPESKATFNIQLLDELFLEKEADDIGLTNRVLNQEEITELMEMQCGLGLLTPDSPVEKILLHAHKKEREKAMWIMFMGRSERISELQIVQDRHSGSLQFNVKQYFNPKGSVGRAIDISVNYTGLCVGDQAVSDALYKVMKYLRIHGNRQRED